MDLKEIKLLKIIENNKNSILKSLSLINYISNETSIKVAYIKILSNLLKFHEGMERYFCNELLTSEMNYRYEQIQKDFSEIKADLKKEFNKQNFISEHTEEFYSLITDIEKGIFEIFDEEEKYEFNNYLIHLINNKKIDEFIWLNTIYNIYKDNGSMKDIVTDYRTFNQIEFSDLYKMYLFVSDYNINTLLLKGESQFIDDEYLAYYSRFFDYMYTLIDDMKTFVPKEEKKHILSFTSKMDSYTNLKTPDKEEFIYLVNKVYGVLNDLLKNDNTKLFLDNVFPVLVKSFYAPLKNDDKIKYDFNTEFLYALEYLQIIKEVMTND